MSCPICLEDLKKEMKLDCGHSYCKSCFEKHHTTSMKNGLNFIALKRGKPFHKNQDDISMFLSIDNSTIKCPMCRKEYTVCSDDFLRNAVYEKKIKPLPIKFRVWFNDPNGELTICHHITSRNDIAEYFSLHDRISINLGKQPSNNGRAAICLMEMAFDTSESPDDFYAAFCPCNKRGCVGVFPIPNFMCERRSRSASESELNIATPEDLYNALLKHRPKKC